MVLPEELVFDLSVFFKIRSEKRRLDENFYFKCQMFLALADLNKST